MNWDRIIAETLVKPHEHNEQPCYRMDCNETEFEMEHFIEKGETVTINASGIDVEINYGLDNGAILYVPQWAEVEFVGHSHGEYYTCLWQPEGVPFVDVEIAVKLEDIDHEHESCTEALDNIREGDSWRWYYDSVYIPA